ncbi:MAG: YbaB/EbfC family nucleoid-associated protein [Kiritimatiellae bacterium]|nr:YbaB/EbfC family nucleoid-associated protein [Kiritimatiellia bacterium]MCO5061277.1 YbaB/EbfC family nucleoid-associated protein [Kiritimatiellia bacterium]MCO6400213.1 YbaB/EbfC family nucleoid-associated protein [Verrucomicrobiota bacterium]
MNVMKLMKQAQAMQQNVQKLQEDLAQREYSFSAGGGAVTAVAGGDMLVKQVTISPQVADPDDLDMLQDLVISAVNGALSAARDDASAEMGKITGGLNIPGM